MKFYPCEQGSEEWYRYRLGRPTSSNFHKIVTPTGQPSKQAVKYLYRLVAERLLHQTMDDEIGYVKWVADGKANEPHAAANLQQVHELRLEPGGFITTDDGRVGASPDRMLNNQREGVEIKCPAYWTQIGYLLDGPGEDYRAQVQGHLLVGEFRAVHFFSWTDRTPSYHKIILPDTTFKVALSSALDTFCDALDICTERARLLGAYAVVRRAERPADLAYQDEGDEQLQVVNPETGDDRGIVP